MRSNRKGCLIMPLFFTKEIKDKNEKYIEPDGAGIIYPYVATKDWNSVYRIEAITKARVNFVCLEAAVKIMKKKYPYFFSRISTHGNKYVFKRGYASNVVVKDSEMCKPFDIKDEDTLLRVVYRNNAIGAEFFHSVTDGHGAQMFFGELLKEYYNILNSPSCYDNPEISAVLTNTLLQSTEDIYDEIYNELGGKSVSRFLSKAYQFDKSNETELTCESIGLFLPALKNAAHKYGSSITEYLCAAQIEAILRTERIKNKTVRISVPVDIRRFFDIDTPRNAALYFLVSVKPKEVKDFKSLVAVVRKQFELQLTKENMQNLAFSNVKCAKMKAYKMLPLGLKKIALNIGYTTFGENQFTSTLTNLGKITLDGKIADELESVYFVLGKEKTKPFNIAVSSFNNEIRLMISSAIDSTDLVKAMRERLLCDGVVSSSAVKSSAAEKAKYPSVS